jgi:flagellar assembly protein FliH
MERPAEQPADLDEVRAAVERDAFAQGFARGEQAATEAARERTEAMLSRLASTVDELSGLRAQMARQTERQMVQLALAIARRVALREVSLDPELLVAMARVAMDRLGEQSQVTVRFNPLDYEAARLDRSARLGGSAVSVLADAHIPRGGCRVESDHGALEAGVEAQLSEVARVLLGDEQAGSTTVGESLHVVVAARGDA